MRIQHRKPAQDSSESEEAVEADSYRTVDGSSRATIKIQASTFISLLRPVTSPVLFGDWLMAVRSEYHDATHHCYAFRCGLQEVASRFSDDGEPSGTAGKRILAALEGHALTDAGLIVVRYFGGTKLGAGGLAHAYTDAAEAVIARGRIVERFLFHRFAIRFDSRYLRTVHHFISLNGGRILSQGFDVMNMYEIEIRRSRAAIFRSALFDAVNGQIDITIRP